MSESYQTPTPTPTPLVRTARPPSDDTLRHFGACLTVRQLRLVLAQWVAENYPGPADATLVVDFGPERAAAQIPLTHHGR